MVGTSIEPNGSSSFVYDHAAWKFKRRICRFLLTTIGFTLLAKIGSVEGSENVPQAGPAILMINHIALIDPIVVLHVLKRDIVPLAKAEVYDYPLVGFFPKMWGVIPVRREEVDRRAVQQVLAVLRAGELVLVAPEGTRSPSLTPGKEGVAYLASRGRVPIVPVAIEGTPGFPALRFTRPWQGPGAQIRFGPPFRFRDEANKPDRGKLRQMTDEAMYALASLLPEARRGVYADLSKATQDTLEWV
jgi:1-acyl-sn-glycerol-3-phosphate acyltransferase